MATQKSTKSNKPAAKKASPSKKAAPKKAVAKAPVKGKTAARPASKPKAAVKAKPAASPKAKKPVTVAKKAPPAKGKPAKGNVAKSAPKAKPGASKAKAPVKPLVKAKPSPAKSAKPVSKPVKKAAPAPKAAAPKAGPAPKSKVVQKANPSAKPQSLKPSAPVKSKAAVVKPAAASPGKAAPVKSVAPAPKKPEPKVVAKSVPVSQPKAADKATVHKIKDNTAKASVGHTVAAHKPAVSTEQPKKVSPPIAAQSAKPFQKMAEKKDIKPFVSAVTSDEPHKTRYSDSELAEFDQLIDQKLIVAREQLEFYLKQLEDMAENPDNKIKSLDDGLSSLESERVSSMASRQQKLIQHLENAKIRIKNKVYGICRETGKLISKERLRAVPHATLSIEAKQAQN